MPVGDWIDRLDWREIAFGVLVGVCATFAIGALVLGLLRILPSNLMQAVITYLPAGLWTGYRARQGSPLVNALVAGGILFLLSSALFAVIGESAFPAIGLWAAQALVVAAVVAAAGILAQVLRNQ